MRRCNLLGGAALVVVFWFCIPAKAGVTLGQTDTFQTPDALGWTIGINSPLVPTVISTGGPQGANDGYLQVISTGSGKANSKLVMFNQSQWTGNYIAAGVTQINTQMANFGANPLSMRVAFQDSFGTEYASTLGIPLPADGRWRAVTFDMTPSAFTVIQGTSPIEQSLADVGLLRILSAANGPAYIADTIAATVGFDNITAVPEPALLAPLLATALLRRKRFVSKSS